MLTPAVMKMTVLAFKIKKKIRICKKHLKLCQSFESDLTHVYINFATVFIKDFN